MVSLRSVESTDVVRKYLKKILPARLTETEKSRRHRKDIQNQLDRFRTIIELTEDGVSDTVDYLARLFISLTGCILLIAPMVALSFIKENKYRLLTVSLFLVVFALSCSLAAFKLTVQELLGAVAAYAAVLVVFISSTPTL
ncbi:hypothetical protein BDZ45DRAFT_280229 [Acephala macrosclerotiorum]|nr:hypothetical protein BDZ45DRAFT_280229 [Acephala macrosclerotiorum]